MNNSSCLVENKVTGSRTGLIWIKGGGDVVLVEKSTFLVFFSAWLVESDIIS